MEELTGSWFLSTPEPSEPATGSWFIPAAKPANSTPPITPDLTHLTSTPEPTQLAPIPEPELVSPALQLAPEPALTFAAESAERNQVCTGSP